MKYLILLLACGTLLLSSCQTVKKTATTVDVENSVSQYPAVADLDIQGKIEGTSEWGFRPFHFGEPSLELAKSNLIADLLKQHNADVLLEPQFIFEKESYGVRRLVVTGFPATYKNFRNATPADIEAAKAFAPLREAREHMNDGGFFSRLLGR